MSKVKINSVDKTDKKVKAKKETTLEDVVKAIDKQGKTFSDALGKVSSSNDKKLKDTVEKITKSSYNKIKELIKEIKDIKTKSVASKEERQQAQRDRNAQKDLDKHAESVAKVENLSAKTNQIIEKTAQDQQKFSLAYKKAIDDLNNSNKKAEQNFQKTAENLQFSINKHQIDLVSMMSKERREQEKHTQSMNERLAKELRESDKHQAWKEDRQYTVNQRNSKNSFSLKDIFSRKSNNTNSSDNTNQYQTYNTNNVGDNINNSYNVNDIPTSTELTTVPNFTMSDNGQSFMSFADIEEKYQQSLGDLQKRVDEQAKQFSKEAQESRLRESKIIENESKIINDRLKAETDNKVRLKDIELKQKQQDFEQKARFTELGLKVQKQDVELKAFEKNQEYKLRKSELDLIAQRNKIEQSLEKFSAWQEDRQYELEKRAKEDEQTRRESYKDSKTYRAVDAVQNAHSGFGTSVLMSAMTGGTINPLLIRAMKLDKLMTAPIQAITRALFRSKKTIPDEYTSSSAIKNSKNADILTKMDTITGKLDKLAEPKEIAAPEKKKKGIIEKIFDGVKGIFGLVGKGLMALLGPAALLMMLPKIKEKAGELLQDFLMNKTGMSENVAGISSKIVMDALPGVLAGFKYGGLRGALLGGALTLGIANIDKIKEAWNIWSGKEEGDNTTNTIIPGIDNATLQGVLGGASVGFMVGGLKGALFGSGIALGYQVLKSLVDKWKGVTENTGDNNNPNIEDIGLGEAGKAVLAGALLGSPFGIKGALIGGAIGLGALSIGKIKEHWDQWTGENADGTAKEVGDIGFGEASSIVLTGAIAGATFGGIKGALIGATVGLAADVILDNVNTFKQLQNNKDMSGMDRLKKTGKLVLEDAIMGASLGALGGPTGMLVGAVIGAGAGIIEGIAANWDVIKAAFTSFTNTISEAWQKVSDIYNEEGVLGVIKLVLGSAWEGVKSVGKKVYNWFTDNEEESDAEKQSSKAVNNITKPLTESAIPEADFTKDGIVIKNKQTDSNTDILQNDVKNLTQNSLVEQALSGNQGSSISSYLLEATSNNDNIADTQGLTIDSGNNLSTVDTSGTTDMGGEVGSTDVQTTPEEGTSDNYKTHIVNGIPAVSMKDLNLSGQIASINSKPYIAPNNVDNLKSLDSTINSWGYDIIYTSAMGGSHKGGPRSHAAGQKVDLQLKKNGKSTRMTKGQENALISAGFARNGTGALGWEPVAGQVLGGHYDYSVGGGKKGQPSSPSESNEKQVASNNYGTTSTASDTSNSAIQMMNYSNTSSATPADVKSMDNITIANNTGMSNDDLINEFEPGASTALNRLFGTNSSPEIQKLEANDVPSVETSNINELAQLNNTIGGNNNDTSVQNLLTDVASNTSSVNQNSTPIIYNNTIGGGSDDDKTAYPVGDLAKTLLYA